MAINTTYQLSEKKEGIIIAGGGTGGHIFPAIAIANAIHKQSPDLPILFVGAKGKMEMEKVPQAGYAIEGIDIAGFNRSSLIKNIGLPVKLIKSFFQVSNIFKKFQPKAVIGVGGYSSFPVLKYAQQKGVPTFIHESNSFAGKANKMLGKKASKIFVASEGMEAFFPASKIIITGNPVRSNIIQSDVSRATARNLFKLDQYKTTVLVTGGSLGAQSINQAIALGLPELIQHDIQIIWQTGNAFRQEALQLAEGKDGVWTDAFIAGMENAYAAADMVVSRAGAMAIAELCVVQKPVILIPYPFAAEDHQTKNALALVNNGAAMMIKDEAVNNELIAALIQLAGNKSKQEEMKKNIASMAVLNADTMIASEVLKTIA